MPEIARRKFTKTYLEGLKHPGGDKPVVLFDTEQTSLGIRLTKTAEPVLIAQFRIAGAGKDGKALQKKITLGRLDQLVRVGDDVDKVRQMVAELKARARGGQAPATAADGPITFAKFADEWLVKNRRKFSPGHVKQIERNIARGKDAFGKKPIADVTPGDLVALRDKIADDPKFGPSAANKMLTVLGPIFGSAVLDRLIPARPTSEVKRIKIEEREAVLSAEEVERFLEAVDTFAERTRPRNGVDPRDIASILRLLVFTGARRGEAFAMDWADVDLEAGIWHRRQPKVKKVVKVPLAEDAVAELRAVRARRDTGPIWMRDSKAVFPSSRSKTGRIMSVQNASKEVLKMAQLPPDLHVHDLRASFASTLAYTLGLPTEQVALLTGHKPGSRALAKHYLRRQEDAADAALKGALAAMSAAYRRPEKEEASA
jgi:integrase